MLMTGARRAVKVPFLDLRPVHEPLKAGILADIAELIDSSAFTNGPAVRRFETAFARVLRHAGTASASRAGSTRSGSGCSPRASSRATR